MKGYKVFNPDWTCKGFQYEVGKTFKYDGKLIPCKRGFHFCTNLSDCFNYYSFDPENKVAEIEATGLIETDYKDSKHCTNEIKIIREISWHEVLEMANTGKACTGINNFGNYNVGHYNTGKYNTSHYNTGNYNTGNCNVGNRNTGNYNTGGSNVGDYNAGYFNICDYNTGDCNVGYYNTGNHNTGSYNIGNGNVGDYNIGNNNTGDNNIGDQNSGDWNLSSYSIGCFNTEKQKLKFFDEETDITWNQWRRSEAYVLLDAIDFSPAKWIMSKDMTKEEKQEHPEHTVTGGYLKEVGRNDCITNWWNNLSSDDKEVIKSIPNFNAEKFYQITGIKVEE